MAGRIRVAVLYGGRSNEHPISVISAGSVLAALDESRYEVRTIAITQDGKWIRTEVDPAALRIEGRTLPVVTATESLPALFHASSGLAELAAVDVVFPVLHGAFGEDGTIQGLLEMAGLPYVGSGVLASAGAMDKVFTKVVLADAGLDVGEYVVIRKGETTSTGHVARLGYPMFVKPARSGSSVGITKVDRAEEFDAALRFAFEHDVKVIVEAAVAGREIECGVLQDADGAVSASVPAEIRLHPDYDWYSFDAKYLDDACDFDVPAKLAPELTMALQATACAAFTALECAGLARVDFFLTADERLIVNEVNTMPGFTPISMYPRMWAESGVDYPELLDRLIATALAR